MADPVVHWELWSEEPDRIADFYKQVFDWEIRYIPAMNYHFVETGATGINGGIMTPQGRGWPGKVGFYIVVSDLDAYGKKITDAGGKLLLEKVALPGIGQFSMFEDPDGRVLGMWQKFA